MAVLGYLPGCVPDRGTVAGLFFKFLFGWHERMHECLASHDKRKVLLSPGHMFFASSNKASFNLFELKIQLLSRPMNKKNITFGLRAT